MAIYAEICSLIARSTAADGYVQYTEAAPPLAKGLRIQTAQPLNPAQLQCFKDRERSWVRWQAERVDQAEQRRLKEREQA